MSLHPDVTHKVSRVIYFIFSGFALIAIMCDWVLFAYAKRFDNKKKNVREIAPTLDLILQTYVYK